MTVRMESAPDRWGIVRRCDAKCHNAEGPDCDCVCGGEYHGSARAQEAHKPEQEADDGD